MRKTSLGWAALAGHQKFERTCLDSFRPDESPPHKRSKTILCAAIQPLSNDKEFLEHNKNLWPQAALDLPLYFQLYERGWLLNLRDSGDLNELSLWSVLATRQAQCSFGTYSDYWGDCPPGWPSASEVRRWTALLLECFLPSPKPSSHQSYV